MNFYKRSNQLILRYLYSGGINRRGETSLQRHLNIRTLALPFRESIVEVSRLQKLPRYSERR